MRESFNAVFIEADAVGELMLYGRGAGGGPTASARAGRPHRRGQEPASAAAGARRSASLARKRRSGRSTRVESQFYLQLEVADQPGVLAEIAAQFGEHDVSIKSMQQNGIGDDARIIFITHRGAGGATCGRPSTSCVT